MTHLLEMASAAFEKQGGLYRVVKSRNGDLVQDGMYGEEFVKRYASVYIDVIIVTKRK